MVTGEDILGSWIMTGRGTDDDTDQALARLRYGDDSQGFMIFAPDGWMNAIVCWGGRPPLPGDPAWHSDAPIDDKVKAFVLRGRGEFEFGLGPVEALSAIEVLEARLRFQICNDRTGVCYPPRRVGVDVALR